MVKLYATNLRNHWSYKVTYFFLLVTRFTHHMNAKNVLNSLKSLGITNHLGLF